MACAGLCCLTREAYIIGHLLKRMNLSQRSHRFAACSLLVNRLDLNYYAANAVNYSEIIHIVATKVFTYSAISIYYLHCPH